MNTYKHETEKIASDPLDPQTVFTIKHSDIPKGVSQCSVHNWRKLNETEIACTKCPTVNIVKNANDYV